MKNKRLLTALLLAAAIIQTGVSSAPASNADISCIYGELKGVDYKRIMSVCSREEIESLVKAHPDCVEYYLAKAKHLGGEDGVSAWDYEAIHFLGEAIKKFPEDSRLYALRAFYQTMTHTESYDADLAIAARDYSVLIRMHPEDISNYLNRCSVLAISGHNPEQALADCGYVIAKTTPTAELYFYKGKANFALKHYRDAIADYSKSMALDSTATYSDRLGWGYRAAYFRAQAYLALNRDYEAVKDYEIAGLDKSASSLRVWDELALMYARLGKKAKMRETLEKSVSEFGASSNLNRVGWAVYYWVFNKDKGNALSHVEELLKDNDFEEERWDKFLHDLYGTDEYKVLKKKHPRPF